MKLNWFVVSGIILAGAGIGAYFFFRKPKEDKKGILNNDKFTDLDLSEKPPTGSSVSYSPTPFANNQQGNHFRGFVNTEYPEIARKTDLDRSVSFANGYDNRYIREAWSLLCKSYIQIAIPMQDPNYNRYSNACK